MPQSVLNAATCLSVLNAAPEAPPLSAIWFAEARRRKKHFEFGPKKLHYSDLTLNKTQKFLLYCQTRIAKSFGISVKWASLTTSSRHRQLANCISREECIAKWFKHICFIASGNLGFPNVAKQLTK